MKELLRLKLFPDGTMWNVEQADAFGQQCIGKIYVASDDSGTDNHPYLIVNARVAILSESPLQGIVVGECEPVFYSKKESEKPE